MGKFREIVRRLSREYEWEMTEDDVKTWAVFAGRFDIDLFGRAVGEYLSDISLDSFGNPNCRSRPKIGQILAQIHTLQAKTAEKKRDQSRRDNYGDINDGSHVQGEALEVHMSDIRTQPWFVRYLARKKSL